MQSIIGSNAALRYLKAYQAHVDYWHEVNPAYQVAYVDKPEHVPYIREYAAALPDTMIVARIYHPLDGGFHLAPTGAGDTRHYVSSPAEYLGAYGDLGKMSNIILNVMNEPNANGTSDEMLRLVEWFVNYIPLAASIGCKSVLFNWADRNPQIINGMMDSQFDDVLKTMAVHPELFYMGMHFYGPDEITSHLDSYVKRCEFLKIKPPKVIGTEFGLDSTGGTERGYKSRANYKDIYAQWQETVVKGSLKPYIDSGVLAGLCVFQEGNSGGFDDFDFENDSAYKTEIKRAALAGEISVPTVVTTPTPPPIVTPPYTPDPFTSGMRYQVTVPADFINVRAAPSTIAAKLGEVPNKAVVTVFEETLVSGEYWRRISFGTISGWVSLQKGAVKFAPYLPDSPSMVSIPIDLLKDIASSLKNDADETRRLSVQMAAISDDLMKDYTLVKAILDKIGAKE
jgi:hypothetical protein